MSTLLQQLWDDTSNSVLTENNGVARKCVATIFRCDSIVFYENRIANIVAALMLMLGINGPLGLESESISRCGNVNKP